MSASVAEPVAASPAAMVREAVGLFREVENLQAAVDELQAAGFSRADISTLARVPVVERALGRPFDSAADLEDDPRVPRSVIVSKRSLGDAEGLLIGVGVYVGACIAAGIWAAGGASVVGILLAVAVAGAIGGLIGYGFARRLDRHYSANWREQLRRGGILLWVTAHSADQEARASEILTRHGAVDVHVHVMSAD